MNNDIDPTLLTADFSYDLPPEQIAQSPVEPRESSRLLVLDRHTGQVTHSQVANIRDYLRSGDVVVANNSRVIPARLNARRAGSGGAVEILLLTRKVGGTWTCMARPAKRLHAGESLIVDSPEGSQLPSGTITVVQKGREGVIEVTLEPEIEEQLVHYGAAPLPPYITKELRDPERYQTVYATQPGSSAAPTAGLHFSKGLIESLAPAGIEWAEVTLHIGLDTFRPVTADRVVDHRIHTEWCSVSDEAAAAIQRARSANRRIIALGTTAARTLETAAAVWETGAREGFSTSTSVFITPGYHWSAVDGMVTNFHLPHSTLLMMVCAFAGRERVLAAYQEAIEARYRFYSFGDAMLIV
ncbi:tRNA preQ1(34) S-adenosylmethionine ribosyltransferase-isomerase QueA [soil metagenome]